MNKKLIKIILILFAAGILIVGSAITYFAITFDQNALKNKLTALVYEKTGRKLEIKGDASWSIFPRLRIKIQNISLSNSNGFKPKHFATAQEFGISIKPIPLILKRTIEADRFAIKDFSLYLTTKKSGKNNWQLKSVANDNSKRSNPTKNNPDKEIKFSINKLTLSNGIIFWQDQQKNQNIKISKLNLNAKDVNLDHPFSLKTSFRLAHFDPRIDGDIKLKTLTTLNFKQNLFIFKNLKLHTDTIVGSGSLKIAKHLKAPTITGDLTITEADAKSLPRLLGMKIKKTPITAFKIVAKLKPKVISIPALEVKFNDMALKGGATYAANNIKFNLNLNKLDPFVFSEYSASTNNPKRSKQSSPNRAANKSSNNSTTKLNGSIKINTIRLKDVNLNNFVAKITGTTDSINISSFNFDLYQKKVSGSATANIRNTPQVGIKIAAKDIPMKPLLIDFAKYKKFSGALSFGTTIKTHGKTTQAMLQNLNGNGNLAIAKGSYLGVDVPYEVRRAHALLNIKSLPKKPEHPQTNFDRLSMSFNMASSIIRTNDLLVEAPNYKVTGEGNANLYRNKIDLALKAYSKNDDSFLLPITITGSITDPSVRPDAAVLLKKGVKKVINTLGEQVKKHIPEDIKKVLPLDKLFK